MSAQVSKRCPECRAVFRNSAAVDRHRALEHGVPIFAEFPVACPECSKEYKNLNAMFRHREEKHSDPGKVRADRAPIHYETAEEGTVVPPLVEPRSDEESARRKRVARAAHQPVGFRGWMRGLWFLTKMLIAFAVLAAVVSIGFDFLLSIGEKDTVKEEKSGPGYSFVRDLRAEDAIYDFRPVKPDSGWDWQYEVDGTAQLRFRRSGLLGNGVEMETEDIRGSPLFDAVEQEARQQGYVTR